MLGVGEGDGGLGFLNYCEVDGGFLCHRRDGGEDRHGCGVERAVMWVEQARLFGCWAAST